MRVRKTETILLILILLLGAFLRLWRIGEYMTFLGDEGRDAIIVRRLLVDFDPILIGPGTSIGNMYIGPLYYYLIAPSLLLANFSPVGPSMFVALLGIVTIWLVWWVGREWFPPSRKASGEQVAWGALIAAFLYSISPTVIIFSRASWNPNVMPFFALLMIYAVWRVWEERKYWWLMVASVSFAFALQSHWLGLLLGPVAGVCWGLAFLSARWEGRVGRLVWTSAISLVVFLVLMSPLLIFDLRHGWINFNNIKTFFTVRQTTVSARPWNAIPNMWPLFAQVSTRLMAGRVEWLGKWLAVGLAAVLLWLWGKKGVLLMGKERKAFGVILLWIGVGLVGLGVYKQHIYDHYFGFMFAAPFLLFGGMVQDLIDKHKVRGWWLVGTAMVLLIWASWVNNPLKGGPNRQLQRTVAVARKVEEEAEGKEFNLAVIAERNYEDAYQYFLEKWGTGVTDIDPLNYEETVGEELYVVCEMSEDKCDPTHNAKAEVANFGWSKIDRQWEVEGTQVYRLIHSNEVEGQDEL